MPDMDFIISFLRQVEGGPETRGYIPCTLKSGGSANYRGDGNPDNYTAMGASGVTIATGFDTGQYDEATLVRFGVPDDLVAILKFYLGKKKSAAIQALHARPLTLSKAQALLLEAAIINGYLHAWVIPAFEKDAARRFATLPREAQAVIMSICYQKGCAGARNGAPKTWKHLTACNWPAASQELITGFKQYAQRRRQEGQLLARIHGGYPCSL